MTDRELQIVLSAIVGVLALWKSISGYMVNREFERWDRERKDILEGLRLGLARLDSHGRDIAVLKKETEYLWDRWHDRTTDTKVTGSGG